MSELYPITQAIASVIQAVQCRAPSIDLATLVGAADIELTAWDPEAGKLYGPISLEDSLEVRRFATTHRHRQLTLHVPTELDLCALALPTPRLALHLDPFAARANRKATPSASQAPVLCRLPHLGARWLIWHRVEFRWPEDAPGSAEVLNGRVVLTSRTESEAR